MTHPLIAIRIVSVTSTARSLEIVGYCSTLGLQYIYNDLVFSNGREYMESRYLMLLEMLWSNCRRQIHSCTEPLKSIIVISTL